MEEYNQQVTNSYQQINQYKASLANDAQLESAVLGNLDDDRVEALLASQQINGLDLSDGVDTSDLVAIQAFLGNPDNAAKIQAVRNGMDSIIEPENNNFIDAPVVAPSTPTTAEIRDRANAIDL